MEKKQQIPPNTFIPIAKKPYVSGSSDYNSSDYYSSGYDSSSGSEVSESAPPLRSASAPSRLKTAGTRKRRRRKQKRRTRRK